MHMVTETRQLRDGEIRTAVSLRTAPVFPFTSLIFVPPKIKFVSPISSSLSMRTRSLPPKRLHSIVKYLHKF